MKRWFVALCVFTVFTAENALALDFKLKDVAEGLAEIISSAVPCGYEIDTTAMEAYYVKVGLATPEGLAYVTDTITLNNFRDKKPDNVSCSLVRATAKSIGVLSEH